MTTHHAFRVACAVFALAVIATIAQTANAGLLRATSADTANPTAKTVAHTTAASADPATLPQCCGTPCITYREAGCCKPCCGSAPPIQTVLKVQDPRSCCTVDVPVCVPACCQGTPCVSSRCGLLCRGVVWYDWDCGFSVKVVFTLCGDLVVTYVN